MMLKSRVIDLSNKLEVCLSKDFNSVFITGGAGYCGSLIVPTLIARGFRVKVYDTLFFSDRFLKSM